MNPVIFQLGPFSLHWYGVFIVGGAVLVEYIFAYPGVGYLLYQGIVTSDYTLIQGIVFMLVFTTATLVLILDLTYPLIDPRITFEPG